MEYNGVIEVEKEPADVANACMKALEDLGFKIKKADRNTGAVYATKYTFNNAFAFSLQIAREGNGTAVIVHFEGEERGLVQAMMGTADSKVNEIVSQFTASVYNSLGIKNQAGW